MAIWFLPTVPLSMKNRFMSYGTLTYKNDIYELISLYICFRCSSEVSESKNIFLSLLI